METELAAMSENLISPEGELGLSEVEQQINAFESQYNMKL